jgi:hypothetical protein
VDAPGQEDYCFCLLCVGCEPEAVKECAQGVEDLLQEYGITGNEEPIIGIETDKEAVYAHYLHHSVHFHEPGTDDGVDHAIE